MNLVAKEYIACQRENPGVLILSEFAGAASELFNATMVNPYDPHHVAVTLRKAMALPAEERRQRMEPMRERVMKFDAQWWARLFVGDLASRVPCPPKRPEIAIAQREICQFVARGGKIAAFIDYDGTTSRDPADPRGGCAE